MSSQGGASGASTTEGLETTSANIVLIEVESLEVDKCIAKDLGELDYSFVTNCLSER